MCQTFKIYYNRLGKKNCSQLKKKEKKKKKKKRKVKTWKEFKYLNTLFYIKKKFNTQFENQQKSSPILLVMF